MPQVSKREFWPWERKCAKEQDAPVAIIVRYIDLNASLGSREITLVSLVHPSWYLSRVNRDQLAMKSIITWYGAESVRAALVRHAKLPQIYIVPIVHATLGISQGQVNATNRWIGKTYEKYNEEHRSVSRHRFWMNKNTNHRR